MPVQVFVDDSGGKGHSRFLVLAGLIADSENWAKFSDEWSLCIASPPSIRRFKMRDAAGRTGEFRQWSIPDRDQKVRLLCRIINRYVNLLTYTIIDLEAHAETWAKQLWTPSSSPYFWPFQNTIMNAAISLWELGLRERFEIIFDESVIFGPRAKAWYPLIREVMHLREPEASAILPIDPMFRSDDEFLPIQAADLFAWLLRHGFDHPQDRPFPWLLEELTNISETEHSQFYDRERMEAVMTESTRQASEGFVPPDLIRMFKTIKGERR
jgi:hypothetical protein